MLPQDRIIPALDVSSLEEAGPLIKELAPYVGPFKVGVQLLTRVGAPKVVEFVHERGGQVFLDGKFHDIPNTNGEAAKAAASLGVAMFNVHASAGIEGMKATVKNKGGASVLAVTVLTSLEENNAHLIYGAPSKAKVLQFARDALIAGCDGVICSPQELTLLDKQEELRGLEKVTPGIRSSSDPADDQKRILSPEEAILAGANRLVIGRPITKAASPVEAAKRIALEIRLGLKKRLHAVLFDLQKIKFGAFKLKLHEKNPDAPLSPIYLNIRDLTEHLYALIGDLLHDLVVEERLDNVDYVIGIPKAGEPIGRALAKAIGKPLLRIEKIEADGGGRISSNILDPFEKGSSVLLVDDLVTKANTKREAIESVEANGLKVKATLVLYDREQGGLAELNAEGQKTIAVSRLSEALEFFVKRKNITSEKMKEVMDYIAAN